MLALGGAQRPLRVNAGATAPEWYDGPIATFTVLTNFQVTGITLQKKTRSITVTEGIVTNIGAESGWTTVHTGTVCP